MNAVARFGRWHSIRVRLLAGFAAMLLLQFAASAAVMWPVDEARIICENLMMAEEQADLIRGALTRLSDMQLLLADFLRTRAAGDGIQLRAVVDDFSGLIEGLNNAGRVSDLVVKDATTLSWQLKRLENAGTAQRQAVTELHTVTKQMRIALEDLAAFGQHVSDRPTANAIAAVGATSLRAFDSLSRYLVSEESVEEANLRSGLRDLLMALEAVPVTAPDIPAEVQQSIQTTSNEVSRLDQSLSPFDDAVAAGRNGRLQLRAIVPQINAVLHQQAALIIETQHQGDQEMAAARSRIRLTLEWAAALGILLGASFAVLLGLSITRPLLRLAETMRQIAGGALDTAVPERQRRDEVGTMAAALQVFKDSMTLNIELVAAEDRLLTANAELTEMAQVDSLTGLANRRCFDEALDAAFRQCKRDSKPLSLILIDVDKFKVFNDTYGHQAGDGCLRMLSMAVSACVMRPEDLAARYGGEELAVVLPDTAQEGAVVIAERIRLAIRDLGIVHDGLAAGVVTASLGVATGYPASRQEPASDILKRADQMLYQAKAAGRDRVMTDCAGVGTISAA